MYIPINEVTKRGNSMAKVTLTSGNRKLGAIINFSMPAGTTCRKDAPCNGKGCYAQRGAFLYSNVRNCHMDNYKAFNEDVEDFKMQFMNQLPLRGYVRIHVAGDIFSMAYLETLFTIAKQAKGVQFMAFTKQYELINDYIAMGKKVPKNFKIIFSAWPNFPMDNPYNLPVSYVDDKNNLDDRIPKTAFKCGGKCDQCFHCWGIKKNQKVVFKKH